MTTSTENQHVYKTDGTEDDRYSVRRENTGHPDGSLWAVARFNGHWVGESREVTNAWSLAREHAKGQG